MKRLLVFQHVPHEVLGTLNPLLKDANFRLRYVNFSREDHPSPSLDRYDGLIVLGGPMGVYQREAHPHLLEEIACIQKMITQDKPILGICLGAQLIAAALGARNYPHSHKEIGWYDVSPTSAGKEDPLLRHFDGEEAIFQWHGDTFDLPLDAVHLASTRTCPNQAFRYKSNVYGLQFHLEVDEEMIARWLELPRYREELYCMEGARLAERIKSQTPIHIKRLKALSQKVFTEYIGLFG